MYRQKTYLEKNDMTGSSEGGPTILSIKLWIPEFDEIQNVRLQSNIMGMICTYIMPIQYPFYKDGFGLKYLI